jgi:hypothetical protein
MAPAPPPVVSWEALGGDPSLLAPFAHAIAVDPPPVADGLALLGAAGSAHLAWGEPERDFALDCWRERLDLRPALIDLWRALDTAGSLEGAELEAALRGAGAHPRCASHCGRLVRVLCELGLATWEGAAGGGPRLLRASAGRTELERSAAHRAYAARLADVEAHLGAAPREAARAAV